MDTDLLTTEDLSLKLGKTPASLAQWRYLGLGPQFVKMGRNVRYRASDVDAWLAAQIRQRTGEPAA